MKRSSLLRRPHVGRVLVVDADERSRSALRLIVEYDGHDVREARNPPQALELLDEFRPHVVLLDPSLPSDGAQPLTEGRSFCEDVLAYPELIQTSIILTSAAPERFDRRAMRWIAACVSRPFDFVELRLLISRAVARAAA